MWRGFQINPISHDCTGESLSFEHFFHDAVRILSRNAFLFLFYFSLHILYINNKESKKKYFKEQGELQLLSLPYIYEL